MVVAQRVAAESVVAQAAVVDIVAVVVVTASQVLLDWTDLLLLPGILQVSY